MKRLRLCTLVLFVLMPLVFAATAQAKLNWKYPVADPTHASDGWGLTDGSLSVHRVFISRHPMLDRFVIYGVPYSWQRPPAPSFLRSPWSYDSIVACWECHSYIEPGASLPVPEYPGDYQALELVSAGEGMSTTNVICAKCHVLRVGTTWSNSVHASNRHRGASGRCVSCHLQLPHGGGLPRLLGYAQDASPYSTIEGGLSAIRLQDYTPTSWRKRDCASSCHSQGFAAWPSGGSVAGSIVDTAAAPVAGAVVTVRDLSAAASSTGAYRLDSLGPGFARVTVSATGFTTRTVDAFVTAGAVFPLSVTLSRP